MPGRGGGRGERARRPAKRGDLDLLVVGHTNLDHFFHVERLPAADRTVPLTAREVRLGGTAASIARVAARLGVRVGLASKVGPDFPSRFRRQLREERVDLAGFTPVPGSRSPACFIVESAHGEQFTLIDQGPMEGDDGGSLPPSLLARTGWVHLATGNPAYQLRVLDRAHRANVRVTADPAQEIFYRWGATPLRRLLEGSELFFANHGELVRAIELLGVRDVRALLDLVPTVVETQGAGGASAWTRAGRTHVDAVAPRRIRQVTGAGDGFRGGFYAGWFRGDPLQECLQYGAWAAARWLETGDPSAVRPRGPPPHPPTHLPRSV